MKSFYMDKEPVTSDEELVADAALKSLPEVTGRHVKFHLRTRAIVNATLLAPRAQLSVRQGSKVNFVGI